MQNFLEYILSTHYKTNIFKKKTNIVMLILITLSIVLMVSSFICYFSGLSSKIVMIQPVVSILLVFIVEIITLIQKVKTSRNCEETLKENQIHLINLRETLNNNSFTSINSPEEYTTLIEMIGSIIEKAEEPLKTFIKYIKDISKILLIPVALILFEFVLEKTTLPIEIIVIIVICCFIVSICTYMFFDSWKVFIGIKTFKYQKLRSDLETLRDLKVFPVENDDSKLLHK